MTRQLHDDLASWERGELRLPDLVERYADDDVESLVEAHVWVSLHATDTSPEPGPDWDVVAGRLEPWDEGDRSDEGSGGEDHQRERDRRGQGGRWPLRRCLGAFLVGAVLAPATTVAAHSDGARAVARHVVREATRLVVPQLPGEAVDDWSTGAAVTKRPALGPVEALVTTGALPTERWPTTDVDIGDGGGGEGGGPAPRVEAAPVNRHAGPEEHAGEPSVPEPGVAPPERRTRLPHGGGDAGDGGSPDDPADEAPTPDEPPASTQPGRSDPTPGHGSPPPHAEAGGRHDKPEKPDKLAKPEQPDKGEHAQKPEKPDKPGKPGQAQKPEKPDKAEKPDKLGKPARGR